MRWATGVTFLIEGEGIVKLKTAIEVFSFFLGWISVRREWRQSADHRLPANKFGVRYQCPGIREQPGPYAAFLKVAANTLTVVTLAFTLVSCGGYTSNGQTGRGTASIAVTAQSGAISHATNISVTVQ
jgi:hypothetical protein